MSRFGGDNKTERKQSIIEKISKFFEKYFGILGSKQSDEDDITYIISEEDDELLNVAEDSEEYRVEE